MTAFVLRIAMSIPLVLSAYVPTITPPKYFGALSAGRSGHGQLAVEEASLLPFARQALDLLVSHHLGKTFVVVDVNCQLNPRLRTEYPVSFIDLFLNTHSNRIEDLMAIRYLYGKTQSSKSTYMALHCSSSLHFDQYGSGLVRSPGRDVVRSLVEYASAPPSQTFAIHLVHTENQPPRKNKEAAFLEIYVSFTATNGTERKPTLWSPNMVCRSYSPFLNMHINMCEQGITLSDLSEVKDSLWCTTTVKVARVEAKDLAIESYIWTTFVGASENKTTRVEFRTTGDISNANATPDEIVRLIEALPMRAFAIVPWISRTEQVSKAVFEWPIWISVLLTAVFTMGIHRVLWPEGFIKWWEILLYFSGSICVPVNWKDANRIRIAALSLALVIGCWQLCSQVVSVYLRGTVVASLQSLPENRVKSVGRCYSIREWIAVSRTLRPALIASQYTRLLVHYDLEHLLHGGVLCWTPKEGQMAHELFGHLRLYEVALKRTQERKRVLVPIFHSGQPSLHCCMRLAQMFLAHGLVRRQRFAVGEISKALDGYFELPYESQCDFSTLTIRCVERHQLYDSLTFSVRLYDLHFPFILLACGLLLAAAVVALMRLCADRRWRRKYLLSYPLWRSRSKIPGGGGYLSRPVMPTLVPFAQ